MKLRHIAALFLVATGLAQSKDLGVSFGRVPDGASKRVALAKELGAGWYRPAPVLLGTASLSCAECEAAKAAGMSLALVVRNSTSDGKASMPVRDEAEVFQQKVGFVLQMYKPALLIVEDEPDNQKDSFAGSPEEYGAELKLACSVAASMQVKCANGGISSAMIAALATEQRWSTDKIDAAKFANEIEVTRASGRAGLKVFGKQASGGKADLDAIVDAAGKYIEKNRGEIDRARALIRGVEQSGVQYFNFHWYELQPDVLPKLIDILRERTKLPMMTDGVGQRSERAFETGEKIRVLREAGVSPILWMASDGADGVIGLADGKGKLRDTGRAFQREAGRAK